jgi:hypothetical protein
MSLDYSISNPYGFAQQAEWTLMSERSWPGFPIAGSVSLGANSATPVSISVTVPDSASDGLNAVTFSATTTGVPQSSSCAHHLHDVTTAVLLSLESAEAQPGRIHLVWVAGEGGALTAMVYRRTQESGWHALGEISADGTRRLAYEDRDVTAGARYGYRLGVTRGGQEMFLAETWIEVPPVPQLALGGLRPNPASHKLAVAFSLPDAGPARLEVLDVSGRRVLDLEVGSLGLGSHVLDLTELDALGTGVFWFRLRQGSRSVIAHGVVIR